MVLHAFYIHAHGRFPAKASGRPIERACPSRVAMVTLVATSVVNMPFVLPAKGCAHHAWDGGRRAKKTGEERERGMHVYMNACCCMNWSTCSGLGNASGITGHEPVPFIVRS